MMLITPEVSIAFHKKTFAKIRQDPNYMSIVEDHLNKIKGNGVSGAHWHRVWSDLLADKSLEEIEELVTANNDRGHQLRQATIFYGIITKEERLEIIKKYRPDFDASKLHRMPHGLLFLHYPHLFTATNIDCGDGWFPVLWEMFEKLEGMGVSVSAITTEHAGLCVELERANDQAQQVINEAISLARVTCEVCGEPGTLHTEFYARVRCQAHKDSAITEGMKFAGKLIKQAQVPLDDELKARLSRMKYGTGQADKTGN